MNASLRFTFPDALRDPKPNGASAGSCRPDINRPLLARADEVIE
jgi:hypothetical protein